MICYLIRHGKDDDSVHGGVINVIQCIEKGIAYSNKANPFPIGNAEIINIEIQS
jgi:broad specificity phosphatase PhoE